jgi:hypothetical protein
MLDLSSVRALRHRHGALSIHPYFGKLDPGLVAALIKELSAEGDTILDPFCGSGTVLHEALLMNRNCIGWDSSPLATMIASAKVSGVEPLEAQELLSWAETLASHGAHRGIVREDVPATLSGPLMPRVQSISSWFGENAIRELAWIRHQIATQSWQAPVAKLLATVAFSRIIIAASKQQGESSYRRVDKEDTPGRAIDLYMTACRDVIAASSAFVAMGNELGRRARFDFAPWESTFCRWEHREALIQTMDARSRESLSDRRPSLVVTSPPYLMAWDYGLYHKFRFYWLGLDLDSYEDSEIGRHLRRKNDDVENYRRDMAQVFAVLRDEMAQSAVIAMVNAPSVVYGQLVDTNAILSEAAALAGWRLNQVLTTLDIPGPHHGMYESLAARRASAPGARGKREHVLLFSR